MGLRRYVVGSDRSPALCGIARRRGFEVGVADALILPYRDNAFDVVICIALLHHLSTAANRRRVLSELLRIVRPGGQVLTTGWALEQGTGSRRTFAAPDTFVSWRLQARFLPGAPVVAGPETETDVATAHASGETQPVSDLSQVASHPRVGDASSACLLAAPAAAPSLATQAGARLTSRGFTVDAASDSVVLQRYCHVFQQGELEQLWATLGAGAVVVEESFFDASNWCVRVTKT